MSYFKNYSDLKICGPLSGLQKRNDCTSAEHERQERENRCIAEETEQMIADLDAFLPQIQRELEGHRFAKESHNLILPDEQAVKGSTKVLCDMVHTAYLSILETIVTNIINDPQYEYKDGIYDILKLPVKNAELEDMMEFISVINKDRPAVVSKYYGNIDNSCWSLGDLAGYVVQLFLA